MAAPIAAPRPLSRCPRRRTRSPRTRAPTPRLTRLCRCHRVSARSQATRPERRPVHMRSVRRSQATRRSSGRRRWPSGRVSIARRPCASSKQLGRNGDSTVSRRSSRRTRSRAPRTMRTTLSGASERRASSRATYSVASTRRRQPRRRVAPTTAWTPRSAATLSTAPVPTAPRGQGVVSVVVSTTWRFPCTTLMRSICCARCSARSEHT